ncbi:Imm8 family immunity protein [Kitasatospora sp. CB02891]|uniref:Imm8 family immunity protein n=1 Tax=Kitasatospora sp. CB02891 TaxID=2020329 RepID=UPI0012FE2816|nr:Imm8 family immunity protein [Kitasatospora sp. CB02891]
MRATVRGFSSPDIDLDEFAPEDPESFAFLLQAIVGPEDGPGSESLQFTVCTPRHLSRLIEDLGVVPGHGLVVVETCRLDRVLAYVERMIGRQTGEDWPAVAKNLGRIGTMEFDDPL